MGERFMKRFDPKNKYFGWGITAFGVIACSILFFMLLQHGKSISGAIDTLLGILSPIIWGMVITYLLWPLVKMFQRKLFEPLLQKIRPKKPVSKSLARGLSVVLAILERRLGSCLWFFLIGVRLLVVERIGVIQYNILGRKYYVS